MKYKELTNETAWKADEWTYEELDTILIARAIIWSARAQSDESTFLDAAAQDFDPSGVPSKKRGNCPKLL